MNAGHQLGPYEILEQLGAGGMGEVWLAQDTRLGRKVAIKVLPAEFAADPERLARFEQEARASAALNHPHIAAVFDVGAATGERRPPTTWSRSTCRGTPCARCWTPARCKLERALALGVEIAEALRRRARGRDRPPRPQAGQHLRHRGRPRQGARLRPRQAHRVGTPAVGSQSMSPTVLGTQAGAIMGTAGYMAPEQAQGEEVDHRADLFAFGCVLYEMATGRQPFAGKNVYDTIGRIVSDEPAAVSEIDPSLPAQLQWIVRKCLAKEPARALPGRGRSGGRPGHAGRRREVRGWRSRPAASAPAATSPIGARRAPGPPGCWRPWRLAALLARRARIVGSAAPRSGRAGTGSSLHPAGTGSRSACRATRRRWRSRRTGPAW